MSLKLPTPSNYFQWKTETDNYFNGQQKYYIWFEIHNEDCDAKYTSLDMEPNVFETNQ